ncbi:MAG TPA: cation diffusion facilitator family transporter, partial [Terriglobales bacterium]|nr:cation diffusion facilitator family transporter [Terriglobales bacterium]
SDLNIRSALVHMVGDTLATLAVVLGGLAIRLTGQNYIDPVLSVLIGVMIVWSSFGIIRESLNILLEGTPRGMELEQVEVALRDINGVNNVHDLHIWSIGSESHALSCHIAIADIPPSESESIMRQVQHTLAERFRILHTTIQFEHVVCDIAHGCIIVPEGDQHRHNH